MKKSATALVTALSGLALVGALTGTAQAATTGATATAPSCATIEHVFIPFSTHDNYDITNGCSNALSVKVAFSNGGFDTDCHALAPGEVKRVKYWAFANPGIKGLVTC